MSKDESKDKSNVEDVIKKLDILTLAITKISDRQEATEKEVQDIKSIDTKYYFVSISITSR